MRTCMKQKTNKPSAGRALRRITVASIIAAMPVMHAGAHRYPAPQDAIEWTKGVIITYGAARISLTEDGKPVDEGSGSVLSLNQARVDAYRKARERALESMTGLVKGIRIDADTMLTDLLERSDMVQSRVAHIVNDRTKMKEYPVDFHSSGCRAELKIFDLLSVIPYRYPAEEMPIRIDNPIPTDYTGLVVDARGCDVTPMILPSIFNEEGLEVFGRYLVDIHAATRDGIVSYAYSDDEAMKNRRAGRHPYYAVAIRGMKGCPVVSDRDIRKVFSSSATINRLKRCRVIFIIDKKGK